MNKEHPITSRNPKGSGKMPKYMKELPVYDSIEIMTGQTGIPFDVVKYAIKNGCPCKIHGRIHLEPFLRWFWSRGDDDKEMNESIDWTKRDKRAGAKMKEINLARAEGKVIDFDEARGFIFKLVRENFFAEIQRLRNELPATLKGKSEVQVAEEIERQAEDIKAALELTLAGWETEIKTRNKKDDAEEEADEN